MDIGIITFHFPYNCGAVLQCYALQTVLERQGHNVSVIDYRPWYHQNRYTVKKNPFTVARANFLRDKETRPLWKRTMSYGRWFAKTALDRSLRRENEASDRLFREFREQYLHTTKCYRTLKSLQKNPPKTDCYIAGSDQLWNERLTGDSFDPAYFLDFGPDTVRRMSYAVGVYMDAERPTEKQNADRLNRYLDRFEGISVREQRGKEMILAIRKEDEIRVDADPTLLADCADYRKLMKKPDGLQPGEYILTCTMGDESEQEVFETADRIGRERGLTVIHSMAYPKRRREDGNNVLMGPCEWLWAVDHAALVVTNSYHAGVFSVLFHKPLIAVPHTVTGYRTEELLGKLGLSELLRGDGKEPNPAVWQESDNKIQEMKSESMAYLVVLTEKYS